MVTPSPNSGETSVLLCRFCGHLNPAEGGTRCANCGAFSGLEAVAQAEAERRSRRVRLDFLRNRLVRATIVILPILGLVFWLLWAYTGLPPDPPLPSTKIGNTLAGFADADWRQAGGGVANWSASTSGALPVDMSLETIWRYVAGSPITAPPALVGQRVYLTAEDGSVVALERGTGNVLWRYDSGLPAAVTPAVTDDLVFVVFRAGIVSALDAETGAPVWSRRLQVASLPSPTVADGRLFVAESDKNRLIALDAATGEPLWDYRLDDWVIAPPAIIDGKVIATANDARVHVLDEATGKLRMIYDAGSARWARGGPLATEDLLHFSSFGGVVWGLDYQGRRYPLERQIQYVRTVLWVWGFTKKGPEQQGYVWSAQTAEEQPYPPALAGSTLIVADASGLVTGLNADSGEILWEFNSSSDITVGATTADSVALIGDENGQVIAVSIADGSQQWVVNLDGAVTASPIVAGGLLLAATASDNGTLTALSFSSK